MKKITLLFTFLFFTLSIFAQTDEKKLALVIGNSAYQHGATLKNPVNDANLMARTLQSLGFTVIKRLNANLRTMQLATAKFTDEIKYYNVALFYYAGHGIQIDGQNYLIPVNAKLDERVMTKFEAFNISFINDAFMQNNENVNIMILDACRDNPFRSWVRGGERGFKKIDNSTRGTIIAFATQPGETASDGKGLNGLYTAKLVEQMKIPQNIENVFKNTRIAVNFASGGKQVPQDWSSLMGDFYFTKNTSTKKNNTINTNTQTNNTTYTQSNNPVFNPGKIEYGKILLNTTIAGDLYLDGNKLGYIQANTEDNELNNITPGSHTIEIRGSQNWKQQITIYKNKTTNITAKIFIKMVFVKGGTFQMGSNNGKNNEKPIQTVTVSDFYIGKYEVTQKQWKEIMGTNPSNFKGDNLPVEKVSWNNIQKFIKKINDRTGENYRLPTEAEWEYAACGGNQSNGYKYSGSNNPGGVAWYNNNSGNKTHIVGTKQANELGIYDMSGNVWEWCSDWYGKNYYSNSPQYNPTGPSSGSFRVNRGGSWGNSSLFMRCANRGNNLPPLSSYFMGFRLAKTN